MQCLLRRHCCLQSAMAMATTMRSFPIVTSSIGTTKIPRHRSSLATTIRASADPPQRATTTTTSTDESKHQSRRSFLWTGTGAAVAASSLVLGADVALADVKLVLSNIEATPVACPEGQTTVTGGTSFGVRCFRVTGDVNNPVKQAVYNADIFGRVYDAQGEPALDAEENLRIDTLAEVPPGKSKVSFQISVSESQAKLGPLQLKNFKATGYLGKVNNRQGSGRIDDIDFSELDDEDYVP